MNELIRSLSGVLPEEDLLQNEPMSLHTTFRAGGCARLFVRLRYADDLEDALRLCVQHNVPYRVIGNGSNLLVSDEGYDGAILCLTGSAAKKDTDSGEDLFSVSILDEAEDEVFLYAGAAAMNAQIASFAKEHALTGYEFAAGIPGTLGGAVIMNAGAYGGEMKDVVSFVDAFRVNANEEDVTEEVTFSNEEMCFSYRTSYMKEHPAYTVTGAVLRLRKGDAQEIAKTVSLLAKQRAEKQPLEFASAGSTFKRPKGHFAGALIEAAGCKGLVIGDAQISEKHCGFLINRGKASATEIHALMQ